MTTTKTKEPSLKQENLKNKTQREHFDLWLSECVDFAPLNTISLQDVYSNYCHFLNLYYRSVPLSKKLFSINLRLTFEKEIQDTKIVFFTRSRVFIQGIKLTEFSFCEKQTENIGNVSETVGNLGAPLGTDLSVAAAKIGGQPGPSSGPVSIPASPRPSLIDPAGLGTPVNANSLANFLSGPISKKLLITTC